MHNKPVKKIYQIKKRPLRKPLSIFVNDILLLLKIAKVKEKYVDLLSPGPITYVLPLDHNSILPNRFFKENIGIRIPNHPIAISILDELKIPIIATSTNISGEKSAYRFSDIPESIKQHLSVVIENDALVSGIESTVIDLTSDRIKILRG